MERLPAPGLEPRRPRTGDGLEAGPPRATRGATRPQNNIRESPGRRTRPLASHCRRGAQDGFSSSDSQLGGDGGAQRTRKALSPGCRWSGQGCQATGRRRLEGGGVFRANADSKTDVPPPYF
uniref:Uncharacterized protein n=1 Tax=Sphaerodactylus townsendi TaxID=933632 RepID=A0ACB8FNZ3_9SAUR